MTASARRRRSSASRLLRDALDVTLRGGEREPVDATVDPRESADVLRLAEFHGVVPFLHVALAGTGHVDPALGEGLAAGYHQGIRTHLLAVQGLRTLQGMLADVTPWLVVKGPVLSSALYQRPDLRSYVDLDVLVPPGRFARAVESLEAQGCTLADRNWDLLRARMPAQLRVRLPSGLWVDLHWHLLNTPRLRQAFPIVADALFEEARDVDIAGVRVRTLGRTDTLVHLAAHACLGGGDRLRWVADLHQAVQHDAPHWDEVVARSRAQRLSLIVGTMLRRADRSLPLGVPKQVLDELGRRPGWAALTGAVDRLVPVERCSGRPTPARIVVRSTRGSVPASAAELARRSTRWLAGGASRDRRERDLDPSSPHSFLHAAGGSAGRAAYLRTVGTEPAQALGSEPATS